MTSLPLAATLKQRGPNAHSGSASRSPSLLLPHSLSRTYIYRAPARVLAETPCAWPPPQSAGFIDLDLRSSCAGVRGVCPAPRHRPMHVVTYATWGLGDRLQALSTESGSEVCSTPRGQAREGSTPSGVPVTDSHLCAGLSSSAARRPMASSWAESPVTQAFGRVPKANTGPPDMSDSNCPGYTRPGKYYPHPGTDPHPTPAQRDAALMPPEEAQREAAT